MAEVAVHNHEVGERGAVRVVNLQVFGLVGVVDGGALFRILAFGRGGFGVGLFATGSRLSILLLSLLLLRNPCFFLLLSLRKRLIHHNQVSLLQSDELVPENKLRLAQQIRTEKWHFNMLVHVLLLQIGVQQKLRQLEPQNADN